MLNLLKAIMTKTTGSALSTAVGGRIYLDEAPACATFPYVVFSIVSSEPHDTFTEQLDDTLIQFSLYSTSTSVSEIAGVYDNLKALFRGATLTITGGTCIWCEQQHLETMVEDITTDAGTGTLRHWAVDFSLMVQQ